jgi:hypothetical protein
MKQVLMRELKSLKKHQYETSRKADIDYVANCFIWLEILRRVRFGEKCVLYQVALNTVQYALPRSHAFLLNRKGLYGKHRRYL